MLQSPARAGVGRLEIEPVMASTVPEVARFLAAFDDGKPHSSAIGDDAPAIERHLRWLLLDNPLTTATSPHGLCLRDGSGAVAGLLLAFPAAFRLGEQRLLGIGSGAFCVEPQAKTFGFYLFKRHLTWPGYAFFFSTTCNAHSGALWRALGASAVPDCDVEYVLPFDAGVVLPAFVAGRTTSPFAIAGARLVGRCANPLLRRAGRASAGLSTVRCRDWEKLAELSRRHRPREWITNERSTEFLQWRYGAGSPNASADICVFRDRRGNEGWFALADTRRGNGYRIHGRLLLDATWPRDRMTFNDVLAAVFGFAASDADALYFRPRPGVDYRACGRWIVRRPMEPASVFAIAGKGRRSLALAELDLVSADGDSAFGVRG